MSQETHLLDARDQAIQGIKHFDWRTLGFSILLLFALGLSFLSSIMASTNFSWGSDPDYRGKFNLDLTEVLPDEKTPWEKEAIDPSTDAYGFLEMAVEDHLPYNILPTKTDFIFIKVDGNQVSSPVLLNQEKIYTITFSVAIVYDVGNVVTRSALNGTALILVVFGVILYVRARRKQNDKTYAGFNTTLAEASELYRPVIWQKYEDRINLKRKTNAWKTHCYKLEAKLDKKAKPDDLRIFYKGTAEEKAANEYAKKKMLLRSYTTDAWIKENLDYTIVKYDKINYRLIFTGKSRGNASIGPHNEYVTKYKNVMMVAENLPRIFIGSGITIFLTLLVIDILSFNVTIIINAIISIINILWNVWLAKDYGERFFEQRDLWDMSFRASHGKEYTGFVKLELTDETKRMEAEAKAAATKPMEVANNG